MTELSGKALNIEDLRQMARRRLTRALFEFIDRGSEDEVGLRHNREALERIKLLGKPQTLPIVIGPTGPAGFAWYRGETALARAAAKAGIPFTLASTSNTPMEEIREKGGGTQWYH